ncbi:MAG: YibE/F family protein [Mitsuokella sp.]|uniref:YibE/F family protein n=1 Tax=Mitsuokella sp. TaxID=2049034 RepID=UPI003F097E45
MKPQSLAKIKAFLKRLAVVGIVFALLAGLLQLNNVTKPSLVNTDGRTFTKAVVTDILRDNVQENGSRIGDQIVALKLADGTEVTANCPNGLLFGTVCEPGMSVVVIASKTGSLSSYTVYSYDRMTAVIAFLAFFCLLLMLVGGRKGVKSVIALGATFACFLFFFFPLLMHGFSPIFAAIITSTLILSLTVFLICGPTKKALAAGLASFGGVLSAGIAAEVFGRMAHLSGYNVPNIEALMFVSQNTKIDVGGLLFAGILFASLGAVLDIAMDVSAAVTEIHEENPEKSERALFKSGMRVGQDVMGTMAATLILAVFGGSLGTWVLDYVYDLPFLQLLNSNSLDIVIMQGLSGGIGVILTVPLAAAFSALLLRHALVSSKQSETAKNAKISEA